MQHSGLLLSFSLATLLCGCDDCDCYYPPPAQPRAVTILVEVYDPVTNFVWENVGVRVVQATQEWSGCVCVNPRVDIFLTDRDGLVFFDEYLLAASDVGFYEDTIGRALLGPRSFEDEAIVRLEVSATGFTTVLVDVQLSWAQPDVFVAVPFN